MLGDLLQSATLELPDCENLEGTDWMENLRWAKTEPSMHFRDTHTDPSVYFRKAYTDPSMHSRKANTEFLVPVLLQTFLTFHFQVHSCVYSQFKSQHNYQLVTPQ